MSNAFTRDEVEQAFQNYWTVGAVGEDWDAFADCFTEDARYAEHFLGHLSGREEIRAWIHDIMSQYPEMYTAYEWHTIEGSKVCVYMQNRRDNPEPGGAPIDFPGITFLEYAGDGQFSLEEDFWSVKGGLATSKQYKALTEKFDPDHAKKRSRQNWPKLPW